MTARFLTLEIDGLVIPASAMGSLQVDYIDQAPRSDRRTADNSLYRRTYGAAQKLRAQVSGEGWAPPGLDGLDTDATHAVKLPKQRAISGTGNIITLPAGRRAGGLYEPVGFATVDGALVGTTITNITGDDYTLATVSGASGYRVEYYPQITAVLTIERGDLNAGRATHGWQVVVEEV